MGVSSVVKGWLRKVDPISLKMQVLINAKGMQTGSYVLGGYNEGESDIDIVFPPSVRVDSFYGAVAYQYGDYQQLAYQSFYVKTREGKVYNLLFMNSDEEYFKWATATTLMQESIKKGGEYTDKKKRVAMFQKLKSEALCSTVSPNP